MALHEPPADRLSIEYIEAMSIPEPNTGCWLWLGGMNKAMYGQIYNGVRNQRLMAHRVSFSASNPEIDISDLEIHHECQNKSCVNPEHLDAVTPKDHRLIEVFLGTVTGYNQHKTHCIHGHELIGRNLVVHRSGRHPDRVERACRICMNDRSRLYRQRKAARERVQ